MQNKTISNLFDKYESWVLKPMQEDVRKHVSRNQFTTFVLLSVIIDNLASIRYLGEIPATATEPKVGKRYRKFIKEYMPSKYGKYRQALYDDFRNKLVHMFQIRKFDIQQSRGSRQLHLAKLPNGRICLNSEVFFKDLYIAFRKLKRDMLGKHAKPAVVAAFEKADYTEWSHEDQSA